MLKLARNNLKEMKDLEFLKDLKVLKSLDLDGCQVQKISGYRAKMFAEFPSL